MNGLAATIWTTTWALPAGCAAAGRAIAAVTVVASAAVIRRADGRSAPGRRYIRCSRGRTRRSSGPGGAGAGPVSPKLQSQTLNRHVPLEPGRAGRTVGRRAGYRSDGSGIYPRDGGTVRTGHGLCDKEQEYRAPTESSNTESRK